LTHCDSSDARFRSGEAHHRRERSGHYRDKFVPAIPEGSPPNPLRRPLAEVTDRNHRHLTEQLMTSARKLAAEPASQAKIQRCLHRFRTAVAGSRPARHSETDGRKSFQVARPRPGSKACRYGGVDPARDGGKRDLSHKRHIISNRVRERK